MAEMPDMKVQVDVTKTALTEKPGLKTTEFWIALGMLIGGAYLLGKGQYELGTALMGASGLGYQGARSYVKGKAVENGAAQ